MPRVRSRSFAVAWQGSKGRSPRQVGQKGPLANVRTAGTADNSQSWTDATFAASRFLQANLSGVGGAIIAMRCHSQNHLSAWMRTHLSLRVVIAEACPEVHGSEFRAVRSALRTRERSKEVGLFARESLNSREN
jgi:hypothetical protein